MNDYLVLLVKYLLSLEPDDGIGKVRLAKLIYFSHKSLVSNELVSTKDLGFIRMPLGPVPIGLKDINDPLISIGHMATGLSFTKQVYKYSGPVSDQIPQFHTVQKFYRELSTFPTSTLVDISHQEPSWIRHVNGDEYFIDNADIAIPLPKVGQEHITPEADNQRLQAKLVEGMLDDIVEESTRLEYPVDSDK